MAHQQAENESAADRHGHPLRSSLLKLSQSPIVNFACWAEEACARAKSVPKAPAASLTTAGGGSASFAATASSSTGWMFATWANLDANGAAPRTSGSRMPGTRKDRRRVTSLLVVRSVITSLSYRREAHHIVVHEHVLFLDERGDLISFAGHHYANRRRPLFIRTLTPRPQITQRATAFRPIHSDQDRFSK